MTSKYYSGTLFVHGRKVVRELQKKALGQKFENLQLWCFYYSFYQISDLAYQ